MKKTMTCVLAIGLFAVVMLLPGCGAPMPSTSTPYSGYTDISFTSATAAPSQEAIFNKITGSIAQNRLYVDPTTCYTESWAIDRVLEHWGVDLRPTWVPADLTLEDGTYTAEFFKDGQMIDYPCYNEFALAYTGADGRQLTVIGTALNETVGDVVYTFEDTKTTDLKNVAVTFGDVSVGTSPRYVAEFSLDGVAVRVVSDYLTKTEFVAVVDSLLSV